MSEHCGFNEALDHSIALTAELERLLLEETAILEGRDPERLRSLVEDKQRVLVQVEQETTRLQAAVEDAGQPFTPDGVAAFLREQDPQPLTSDALSARWSALRDLAARCDLMNRANGQAIERGRARVATALNILRGEDDSANVYTARGYAQSAPLLGHSLSEA